MKPIAKAPVREGVLLFDGVLAAVGGEVFFEDAEALRISEMLGHSCLGCCTSNNCQLFSVHHKGALIKGK